MRSLAAAACLLLMTGTTVRPQQSAARLPDRVRDYIARFEQEAAALVAEERYVQRLEPRGRAPADPVETRVLRSDYVLVKPADTEPWLGYRDIFEVDGAPVREREARVVQILGTTAPDSLARAAAFAREGSRFNLGPERTVNTPLMPLQVLGARHADRIRLRSGRIDRRADLATLRIDEPNRPTVIRTPEGFDVWSRGEITVRLSDGAIVRALLRFQFARGGKGDESTLEVEYGEVPGVAVLLPLRMTERLAIADGNSLVGHATYSNYRRFQTSARIR